MICCRELCVAYGRQEVLRGISFAAAAGEHVVVIGANGSGKTTLLRALSGVVSIRKGMVLLQGEALDRLSPRERARRVASVPQHTGALPQLTVEALVLLGRYPHLHWWGGYGPGDRKAVCEALCQVGAEFLAQRPVQDLSGGELQRVLLARALAQDSPCLLLDELSSGLDMGYMRQIFDVLEACRAAGRCLITVMHDLNLAALYATRLLGIKAGRLVFDGPVEDVFTREALSELYETALHVFPHPVLGVPQVCPGAAAGAVVRRRTSGSCDPHHG